MESLRLTACFLGFFICHAVSLGQDNSGLSPPDQPPADPPPSTQMNQLQPPPSPVKESDPFSIPEARLWVKYAGVAQCLFNETELQLWTCPPCIGLPALSLTVIPKNDFDVRGFVGTDNSIIVVAFSGTDPSSAQNWAANMLVVRQKLGSYSADGCIDCLVHPGFLGGWNLVSNHVMDAVKQKLAANPSAKVHVTGHSLGGALAVFAALEMIQNGIKVHSLYTFAQPLMGNRAFNEYGLEAVERQGATLHRITFRKDPIPCMPAELGMTPMATEVHFPDADETVVRFSGEDAITRERSDKSPQTCGSKFYFPWPVKNWQDHNIYPGFNFFENQIQCKAGKVKQEVDEWKKKSEKLQSDSQQLWSEFAAKVKRADRTGMLSSSNNTVSPSI